MTTGPTFFIEYNQAQLRTCPGRSETFNCRARGNNMTVCSNSFGEFFQCGLDKIEGVFVQRTPLYTLLNRVGAGSTQSENLSTEKDASGGEDMSFNSACFGSS